MSLLDLLRTHLSDIHAGWHIGSFGAIGEFHQRKTDQLMINALDRLTRATEKGAIRLDVSQIETVTPLAYETLSPHRHRWSHGMALCLPKTDAAMAQRSVLTEIGPDQDAIRPQDQGAYLFDMGLAQHHIDFCIRSDDPALIETLRSHEGKDLLEPGSAAMAAILRHHPHRVVMSKLGRVEVYQKIGGPDTGGVSPDGPHTHVLPKLLRSGQSHSANIPLPDGYFPCASLHPASAVLNAAGEDIPFDMDRYEAFEAILNTYGASNYVAVKSQIWAAYARKETVAAYTEPTSRLERMALRNSLRQMLRIAEYKQDEALQAWLELWVNAFDRPS